METIIRRLASALFPSLFRASRFIGSFPFSLPLSIAWTTTFWPLPIFIWHNITSFLTILRRLIWLTPNNVYIFLHNTFRPQNHNITHRHENLHKHFIAAI